MKFWIKHRVTPQSNYWVPYGKFTEKTAKAIERPVYGTNVMHSFETESAYRDRIAELKKEGERVQ